MSRPGFRITRLEDTHDDTIELLLDDQADDDVEHLRALLDETAAEIHRLRGSNTSLRTAKEILFTEANKLRGQLTEARVEITNLKFAAAFPELAAADLTSETEPG